MKKAGFMMATILLFSIGSVLLLVGCEAEVTEYEMVEGTLLNAEMKNGKFAFAFAAESGKVFDNYEIAKNYEIQIDNELEKPKLTYAKPFIVVTNSKGKVVDKRAKYDKEYVHGEGFLDSGTKIIITMNEDSYYGIFGESTIIKGN